MQVSSKGRYGLRAMLELALQYGRGPTALNEIAGEQEISFKYLEQLIATLRSAGLVRSVRGPHGGYQLAKPPEEIKLVEIIEILEGPADPVECLVNPDICDRSEVCAPRDIWGEMGEAVEEVLGGKTLKDLARLQREKTERAKSSG